MFHTVLIALHAGTGVLALLAGTVALLRAGRFFGTYLVSLVATTVFLAGAVVTDWVVFDPGTRVLFTALVLLAVVMVARGVLAGRVRPTAGRPSPGYLEHVGFTLVALLDAFVVVTVLNAGAPVWLVVASGVLLAGAGHVALRRTKQVLAGGPAPVTG